MDNRGFSPTKKRRADDFEASNSSTLQSPDLWFTDGDLVLQAETTQFRVHRERLSQASPFFYENFIGDEFGAPGAQHRRRISSILVDGCPLVYVLERAKMWSDLLMAIYNIFIDVYPIDRLLSLLLLGHKYRFDLYRDVAASRLRNTIPCTSLAEWDASGLCNPAAGPQQPLFTSGYEFDLLNAALEAGLQSLLPVAYFLCLRDQGEHRILDGVQHADGTFVYLPRRIQHTLVAARNELTYLGILHTELEPRRLLQEAYFTNTVVCEAPPVPFLVNQDQAQDQAQGYDHGATTTTTTTTTTMNIHTTCANRSHSTDQWELHLARAPGLALRSIKGEHVARCIPCTVFLTMHIQQGREKIWEALPLVFGLPARAQLIDAF